MRKAAKPNLLFIGPMPPRFTGVPIHSSQVLRGLARLGYGAAAIAPISAVIDGTLQSDDRPSPNAGFSAEQLASIIVPVMLIAGTAVAVGIGLFITFIGLQNLKLIVKNDAVLVGLGELGPTVLVGIAGLLLMAVLETRRIKGSILIGILATAAAGFVGDLRDSADRLGAIDGIEGVRRLLVAEPERFVGAVAEKLIDLRQDDKNLGGLRW